jgi:hypothetical protein
MPYGQVEESVAEVQGTRQTCLELPETAASAQIMPGGWLPQPTVGSQSSP